ncbi:hypothetical protein [Polaribacter uvawellassae]|uniref:hypothetical protein n=1 Tax=Polaribacter uvawellassae TaxID=3133495 RepID=UPI003218E6EB
MKNFKNQISIYVLILSSALIVSCSSNNVEETLEPQLTGRSKVYNLAALTNTNISGTATFLEYEDSSTGIKLDLQNTTTGNTHPAHIHLNTAVEGGEVKITLAPVDGATGKSTINIKTKDDGSSITYNELLEYNGYINIHLSASQAATIVAQGDIGQNELTGKLKEYPLATKDVAGIDGVAKFYERVNGSTLAVIILNNPKPAGSYPVHIHSGAAGTGGGIILPLNNVDGATGKSKTQITKLADNTDLPYSEIKNLDGYINVHKSAAEISTIVAQGNIGINDGKPVITKNYNVTNTGGTAYVFNNDVLTNASNPNFTLKRGKTYTFKVNTPGHPFLIKSVQGTGTSDMYNDGVTDNGTASGTITFTVPANAPNKLFYNCEFHGVMTGEITIVD